MSQSTGNSGKIDLSQLRYSLGTPLTEEQFRKLQEEQRRNGGPELMTKKVSLPSATTREELLEKLHAKQKEASQARQKNVRDNKEPSTQ